MHAQPSRMVDDLPRPDKCRSRARLPLFVECPSLGFKFQIDPSGCGMAGRVDVNGLTPFPAPEYTST